MTSLPRRKRNLAGYIAGFTLIEVMITVAVVAILAAVALPQYFDYVTRSRIVEAKTNLADMRTRLEQYFLDNRAYPTGCAVGATTPPNISLPASQKYFDVACAFNGPPPAVPGYTITAAGVSPGPMAGFGYTVNEANTRTTTGTGSWGKTSTTCWISKKSGEC